MPSIAFAGGLLDGYYGKMAEERDRKERNAMEAVNFLLKTGRVKDYNDLMPLLSTAFGDPSKGGKGKGGKAGSDPHSVLAQFLNPALKMAQDPGSKTAGGQDRPSFQQPKKLLRTEGEQQTLEQSVSDTAQEHKGAIDTKTKIAETTGNLEAKKSLAERWTAQGMDKEEAYDRVGLPKPPTLKAPTAERDVQPDPSSPTGYVRKYMNADGSVARVEPAPPPASAKETGPLAERKKELIAQGIPPDRANAVAAMQLEKERGVKQQQASTRLGAYVAMSRQALLTNTERYNEMRDVAPYTLAAKIQGIDLALEKMDLAVERQNLAEAKGEKASSDASKIVQAATKTATQLAGKQSSILMKLGLEDDEATIRRNLIQELSGGGDPDQIEALAKAKATAPAATAPKPTRKVGDVITLKDGSKHKILHLLPGGKYNLDPAPIQP